jgi:FtsH-binding integral membrane protein
MASYETTETTRGFLLSGREWKVVGLATGLMVLNVFLILALVATPLATVNQYLFSAPIVGVIAYGVALVAGEWIAERGVETDSTGLAVGGMAILQFAFGTFGAGVLAFLPAELHVPAVGITAAVTAGMTLLLATYVYARSKDFDRWSTYANVSFVGGLIAIAIGTFVLPVLLLAGFVLIFLGFLLRLGWEIWRVRERRDVSVALQAIGIYIALVGVFVHVLQIVVRMLARRE